MPKNAGACSYFKVKTIPLPEKSYVTECKKEVAVEDEIVWCEGFGRIESWTISGYEDGSPTIWISTDVADYDRARPAGLFAAAGAIKDQRREIWTSLRPT
ncbi:hypothetical protein E5676_scaffold225G00450 [Cucumis melo var. makuwa]|uniref:RFTS domain-containing protein n=1 Tax=Cucumis melo var. makuwa TaxID=1194695 RepID=A0A5A7UJG3_CUCMM|nr:hypothetical protein E6C27_scaffold319G001710 [Cucumis melo var. makuwa]TYK27710.1 hypothetical protein E5676_scaffold225G00450 [Cucumis melo var. makuwa]